MSRKRLAFYLFPLIALFLCMFLVAAVLPPSGSYSFLTPQDRIFKRDVEIRPAVWDDENAGLSLASGSLPSAAVPLTDLPPNVPLPMNINCALIVTDLTRISEQNETFTASVSLRLQWQDFRLAFTERELDRYEYSGEDAVARLSEIWTPEITIDNMVGSPMRDEQGLIIAADGTVTYIRSLSADFYNSYELADFPMDSQRLSFHIMSRKHNLTHVNFVQSPKDLDYSGVQPGVKLSGWQNGTRMTFIPSRFRGWDGDFYPEMVASIPVDREPLNIIASIFVPLFLIFLTAMFPLWGDEMGIMDRINSIAGSMLALIAFNFTVTLSYPMLDADSSVIQIFWVGFAFLWVILLLAMTFLNPFISKYLGNKYAVAEFADFLKWSVPLSLVIILVRIMLLVLI